MSLHRKKRTPITRLASPGPSIQWFHTIIQLSYLLSFVRPCRPGHAIPTFSPPGHSIHPGDLSIELVTTSPPTHSMISLIFCGSGKSLTNLWFVYVYAVRYCKCNCCTWRDITHQVSCRTASDALMHRCVIMYGELCGAYLFPVWLRLLASVWFSFIHWRQMRSRTVRAGRRT